MDNAIEEMMSWKCLMLHRHIALMSYVLFSIEPLACHGSKQPSSLTPLANGATSIVGNAVVQILLRSISTKPLAIAIALSPECRCLNAVAQAPGGLLC